jgi:polysaccharide biosynthesis protein PslA
MAAPVGLNQVKQAMSATSGPFPLWQANRDKRQVSVATLIAAFCVCDLLIAIVSASASDYVLIPGSQLRLWLTASSDGARWGGSMIVAAGLFVSLSLWQHGAYRVSAIATAKSNICTLLLSWVYAAGLMGLFSTGMLAAHGPARHWVVSSRVSAEWILLFLALGLASAVAMRVAWLLIGPRELTLSSGKRAVVIGAGSDTERVARMLRNAPCPYDVVTVPYSSEDDPHAAEVIRALDAERVFVTLPDRDGGDALQLIRHLSSRPLNVRIVPPLNGVAGLPYEVAVEHGVPVFRVADRPISGFSNVLKRLEDIILASLVIVLLAPLLLCAALAIKLESRGPVIFRQPREGFDGQIFTVFKFRTMWATMEDRLASKQTERNDPRLTRVGGFLRRHSLDELPQLFNVLLGQMSIVGPRPHALGTTTGGLPLAEVVENYAARHRVKPGLTGWAQVNGWRGRLDTVEKALRRTEYDLFYIDNWSLILDLRIILKTFLLVFRDEQAY